MFGCDPMYYGSEARWAVDKSIEIVSEIVNEYKDTYVRKETLNQYIWERDVAISQLEELGLSLGQNVDNVKEAINFKKYFDELYGEGLEVANWHLNGDLESFDNFYENALQNGN